MQFPGGAETRCASPGQDTAGIARTSQGNPRQAQGQQIRLSLHGRLQADFFFQIAEEVPDYRISATDKNGNYRRGD